MLKLEDNINFVNDPSGRLEMAVEHATGLTEKRIAIDVMRQDNKGKLRAAAEKSYTALEAMVIVLLTFEDGHTALSRQNIQVVEGLGEAANNFEVLDQVSRSCSDALGVSAGDCNNMRDAAYGFMQDLENYARNFNGEIQGIQSIMNQWQDTLNDVANRESECKEQLRRANDSAVDFGNQFLSVFSGDTERRLRDDIINAQDRLRSNLNRQSEAREKIQYYYKIQMTSRNCSAATHDLSRTIQPILDGFRDEFKALVDMQGVEEKICDGLKRLRNQIISVDYVTSRDLSLAVTLALLKADDNVWDRENFFEDTENRIKEAIRGKIGEDGLRALEQPHAVEQFFLD